MAFCRAMTSSRRPAWFEKGDRSHPDLVKLDALRLSYPEWASDFKSAEAAHLEGRNFQSKLFRLEECQRVHNGDRSHSRLVELDSLLLTYPGWKENFEKVEEWHLENNETHIAELQFKNMIKGLINKQQLFLGDRSHPNLRELYSLDFNYPGWQEDFSQAKSAHEGGTGFAWRLQTLKFKQRAHDGDRSHWRLLELDYLISFLTYPLWENDVNNMEHFHYSNKDNQVYNRFFRRKLEGLKIKEQIFLGNRSHPSLVELDGLRLNYPECECDVRAAERALCQGYIFDKKLDYMKEKQRMYNGNRSHRRLVAIDSLLLSYPGWEKDAKEAEQFHLDNNDSFSTQFMKKIEGMKNKQKLFVGYHSSDDNERNGTHSNSLDPGICVICMSNPKSHVFVPCGHFCSCGSCAADSMNINGSCPICRQDAHHIMRVFFA
jgi:hypothetical protein